MTPPPPPEPEGPSLPARHRPTKDSLASDTTERGFWDLDDLDEAGSSNPAPAKVQPRGSLPNSPDSPHQIMVRGSNEGGVPISPGKGGFTRRLNTLEKFLSERESKTAAQAAAGPPPEPAPPPDIPVEAPPVETEVWAPPEPSLPTHSPVEDVFAEIVDNIELPAKPEPPIAEPPSEEPTAPVNRPAPAPTPRASDDEFSPPILPDAKPLSLRPSVKLSSFELAGIACLALMLLSGGIWIYLQTLNRIGHLGTSHTETKLPIKGSFVAVTKMETYWRAPLTGSKPESVRRGVVLIPVVEITLNGGPGAIRFQFTNDLGKATGDPISRVVNGETTLAIPSTDGFEDISLHAAYRTNLAKPWHIQITEAPNANSSGSEFKTLLVAPISPEKH